MARPSKYTDQLAENYCDRIATSERGAAQICREDDDMPSYTTIKNWLDDETKAQFLAKYVRAKEDQADFIAEQALKIADAMDNDVIVREDKTEVINYNVIHRDRLRVDTRKWILEKLHPKKYGNRVEIDNKNNNVTVKVVRG